MAKKTAYCAMLTALAMIFSYIESLIPFSFGIPGVKLGLSNLVVLMALYFFPSDWVLLVMLLKITLMSFLFGNLSMMIYSIAGGILSFVMMLLFKRINGFSMIGVSIIGGVSHNIGQLCAAVLIVGSIAPLSYMPVLIVSGAITGALIGIVSYRIRRTVRKGL